MVASFLWYKQVVQIHGAHDHLSKDRHGTYYFRKAIPPALRPIMPGDRKGKAVWKRSLRTKDAKAAKKLAARTLSECDTDFEAAERAMHGKPAANTPLLPSFSSPNAKDIEADFYRATLKGDDAFRAEGDARRIHQTPEERLQWPNLTSVPFGKRGMDETQELAYREELALHLGDYRQAAGQIVSSSQNSLTTFPERNDLRRQYLAKIKRFGVCWTCQTESKL